MVFSPRFTYRTVMFRLRPHDLRFPPVEQATPEGLLAVGGDLRPERLLEAYRHGIFPWYNEDDPILWWSPDPRAVLFPEKLHASPQRTAYSCHRSTHEHHLTRPELRRIALHTA